MKEDEIATLEQKKDKTLRFIKFLKQQIKKSRRNFKVKKLHLYSLKRQNERVKLINKEIRRLKEGH